MRRCYKLDQPVVCQDKVLYYPVVYEFVQKSEGSIFVFFL